MTTTERKAKRIAHIKAHLENGFPLTKVIHNIDNNLGNPTACLMSLAAHAEASGMYAWFGLRDLSSMRQWFYVAAKINERICRSASYSDTAASRFLQLRFPLLSNSQVAIKAFASNDTGFEQHRVGDSQTHDYWAYQGIVALRGDWEQLRTRCERVLANPPNTKREARYLIDHSFYLALANSDEKLMTSAINSMVAPDLVQARQDDDSGFAADLISTSAVICTKIAWFHGYNIHVDSDLVPIEWMPMKPLAHYDLHYDFLRK